MKNYVLKQSSTSRHNYYLFIIYDHSPSRPILFNLFIWNSAAKLRKNQAVAVSRKPFEQVTLYLLVSLPVHPSQSV
jgi:hypothetical protein